MSSIELKILNNCWKDKVIFFVIDEIIDKAIKIKLFSSILDISKENIY